VLRPLEEAERAIDSLETYESPAVLKEALRASWHAVERSLRLLLRSDATAPDSIRLAALSAGDMTLDTVVGELRRRNRISIQFAGQVHEMSQSQGRIEREGPRASDADLAQSLVHALRSTVHELADRPMRDAAHGAVVDEALGDEVRAVPLSSRVPSVLRRPIVLGALAGTILIVGILAVLLFGRGSDMEEGIAAFREERYGVAEERFRAALGRNQDNVTARLYLSRILRSQGRNQEVAELLQGAAEVAPRDPAVRRELGRFFIDLKQPAMAVEQFKIAVEQGPEEQVNWVGLIEALYRAGDPTVEQWVTRAPPAVQAMVRSGRR
jgi:tetratricopeptide (TPR) repeat protein